MNKKFTRILAAFALLTLFALPMKVWADEAGFSLATATTVPLEANANPQTTTIAGSQSETWSVEIIGTWTSSSMQGSAGDKLWQMGAKNQAISSAIFSTSGISGTITSVVVHCSSYSSKAVVNCTVGGSSFGTQNQTTASWTTHNNVTFDGSSSGEIIVTFDNSASGARAVYIQSITVTYTTGGGSTDPSITISGDEIQNDKVTLNWNDQEVYTADVVYGNMDTPSSDDVTVGVYSDESCETVFTGNWFTAVFATNSVESIEYAFLENNASSDSRTVYMRVETYNAEETDLVPCNVIAITQSAQPQVATPTFSPAAGAVSVGTTVTLSCATADATIVYSVNDGDMIEQTSPVQITINEDTEIEAFATASGYRDSETVTANYTLRGNAVFVDGVYYESIESQASFDNMEVVNIVGENQNWHYDLDEEAAYINGYNSGKVDNYDWLISPKMVVENGKLSISFLVWHNYADNQLSLKWSTSNNVNGQWYDLEFDEGARNSQNFVHVDNIIIESNDPVYVAFVYDNRASTSAALYEICQFKAKQCHTLTVSDLVNVNTFVFADDENNMLLEGEGLASVGVSSNVMVSVEVSEDYVLSSLMVDDEDHKNDINGGMYTFTMPNHNVTVTATATRRPYYTVTFTTNGIDDVTMEVNYEQAIGTQPEANEAYIPDGFEFVGWYAGDYEDMNTAPNYITFPYTPTNDVTLKAVFAEVTESGTTSLTKMTSNETFEVGNKVVIVASDNVAMYQETVSSSYVNKYTFVNNVETVAADDKNWFTVSAGSANNTWKLGDATNGYVYTSGSNNLKVDTENSTDFTLAWDDNNSKFTLVGNGRWLSYRSDLSSNKYFRMGGVTTSSPSGVAYFDIYKYSTGNVSYSNYRTSYTQSCTLTIDGYGESGGWRLIASPVAVSPATVEGLVVANTDPNYQYFDLYYFDQTGETNGKEWKNYKKNAFNLVPGKGYLYAKKATTENPTYSFTLEGTQYSGNGVIDLIYSTDNEDANMHGWNLIGNPFSTAATLNMPFFKMNSTGSGFTSQDANSSVAAMEGVLVYAYDDDASQPISTATFTAPGRSNSESAAMVNIDIVNNFGAVMDNVIVNFNEGLLLPKFYFGTQNANIYVPQGNKEYAIVNAEAQGEMPVSFRAAKNGTYTLTVNPEGVEMNYLHLIDNMTGIDIDLLQTPNYTFESRTTDYTSRFRLVFGANGASAGSASDETFAYFNGSEWMINNSGNATLQVVDVMGRVLSSETVNGSVSKAINAPAGVYMLRLINGNDVKTQKIVVR